MKDPDWTSPTWNFVNDWLQKKIAELRLQNDSLALEAVATASLRGQISAYKQMAEMPKTMSRAKIRLEQSRQNAGEE